MGWASRPGEVEGDDPAAESLFPPQIRLDRVCFVISNIVLKKIQIKCLFFVFFRCNPDSLAGSVGGYFQTFLASYIYN